MKFVLALFMLIIAIPLVLSAEECRFGEVNCSYPGQCGAYIDKDKNGLCDSSEILEQENIKIENKVPFKSKYYFLLIAIATVSLYLLSYFLLKNRVFHKKIWNFVLLVSFLITGILGILLLLRIEFGIESFDRIFQLFWHVEAGIIMSIVSIFHALWHLSYYKSYFKRRKKTENILIPDETEKSL